MLKQLGATGGMGIGGGALKFYYTGTAERFSVANTRIDAKEPLYFNILVHILNQINFYSIHRNAYIQPLV